MEDMSMLRRALKNALAHELPGEDAHRLMDPLRPKQRSAVDKGAARESAVLILLSIGEEGIKFPLIQRPKYDGPHSGQIALPGGKQEETDRNLEHTALRETHEEIGIIPEHVQMLGKLSTVYIPPSNFNLTPYVGWMDLTPDYVNDSREVESLFEVYLHELIDPSMRKDTSIQLKNNFKISAPSFDLKGGIVWGATAMILSEFSMIVKNLSYE